jgi:CRP-like cAMP-binding protein
MLETQPELVLRVQQQDLASYLDMHQATLSHQRRNLQKQPKAKQNKKKK